MAKAVLVKGNDNEPMNFCDACMIHDRPWNQEGSARGQANKSARGMPWHQEPTKDVTSCDKLR